MYYFARQQKYTRLVLYTQKISEKGKNLTTLEQGKGIYSIAAFHNCSHETPMFHELTYNKQTLNYPTVYFILR